MIYDCFTFFDEFDLLELRLSILDETVDYFVIAEAPFTFRGAPKPLHLRNAIERFAKWRKKMLLLTYTGPVSDNPWQNEWGQRDFLAHGFEGCAPDDLVLIGDCDEIPDPNNVPIRPAGKPIVGHDQRLSLGYVNRVHATDRWVGTRTILAGTLPRYGTLSAVRKQALTEVEIVAGGWHFTSLGGAEVMERKMRSFSHTELDTPYDRDRMKLEVHFANAGGVTWMPIDDGFPRPIREDERWSKFIWNGPTVADPALVAGLEHAHGCFGYIPPEAETVAVISDAAAAWRAAGSARYGARFLGVAPHARALDARLGARSWVVLDGIERYPCDTLALLRARGVGAIVYATNSRSFRTFNGVLTGGAFPPGRALGRAEVETIVREAGYTIAAFDRINTREVYIPWANLPATLSLRIGPVGFPDMPQDELRTYMSHAHLYVLEPGTPP